MAKKKNKDIVEKENDTPLTENNGELKLPPSFPTKEEISADPDGYKRAYNIPVDALLCWRISELPKYFKQHDNYFFSDKLSLSEGEWTTPIWCQVITDHSIVEVLEMMYHLRMKAKSLGVSIAN